MNNPSEIYKVGDSALLLGRSVVVTSVFDRVGIVGAASVSVSWWYAGVLKTKDLVAHEIDAFLKPEPEKA